MVRTALLAAGGRLALGCACAAAVVGGGGGEIAGNCRASAAEAAPSGGTPTFETAIRPLLKVYCLDCHGAEEHLEGGLDLRLRRLAVQGGVSGPAVTPGDVEASLLVHRIRVGEMPPAGKKVPAESRALIEAWIAAGARVEREEPASLPAGLGITPEERAFWCFQPLARPEPPALDRIVGSPGELAEHPDADVVRTPIDRFLLARLRSQGLRFSPEADRLALVRRVAFDLCGLPPTPVEIEAYLNDPSELAYEKMVDRFLDSPAYGERWGRHWLDVAGYADSDGDGNADTPRPYAYKYRDYVIRALNADVPFDQFVIEQLAGDELASRPWEELSAEQLDKLAATGFLHMAADATAGAADLEEAANRAVGDVLKVVSTSLLGLSVGCAQCHDHKYDPISQVDYYRLRAVFEPALDPSRWRRPQERLVSLSTAADRQQAAAIDAEVQALQQAYQEKQTRLVAEAFEQNLQRFEDALQAPLREAFFTPEAARTADHNDLLLRHPSANVSPGVLYQYNQAAADDLKQDQARIDAKRAEKPPEDFVSVTTEPGGGLPTTHLFYRGDHRDRRQAVEPGDLTIAAPDGARWEFAAPDPAGPTSGRRLAWARQLMSGTHPLAGRALVNRVWMHHFGRGIVETAGDLGMLGGRPTHPELLDWLAVEFAAQGWSLKQLHRSVMHSHAYRQSSGEARPGAARSGDGAAGIDPRQVDALNALYWKFPLRRLEAETLRDAMLAVAGRLDRTLFGPAAAVQEDFAGQVDAQADCVRRSVYLQVRRSRPVSLLAAFDAPVMAVNCERRVASVGPVQSLMLMNNDWVLKQAEHFARRLRAETPNDYAPRQAAAFARRVPSFAADWRYGSGRFDAQSGRVEDFRPLPRFTGEAWQGGAELPDPQLGGVLLNAQGGHPGDAAHAAIRRWIAPADGVASIGGTLVHAAEQGDGVRAAIVSSRQGAVGQWTVRAGQAATEIARIDVEAGDAVDFVVDGRSTAESDAFAWNPTIRLQTPGDSAERAWNATADFRGPLGAELPRQAAYAWQAAYQRPIDDGELALVCDFLAAQIGQLRAQGDASDHELAALASLCQQLLSSHEFLYVE